MRICVIFRGENVRKNHYDFNRRYTDILMCWENIKKSIYNDLFENGYSCEIAFITYESEILKNIKEIIKPRYIEIHKKEDQFKNFADVISFISKHQNEYDRFVILRCDMMYRKYITKWPKWNKKGIFILNKDVHWPSVKLYSDVFFMLDSDFLDDFKDAFFKGKHECTIHGLGGYLYKNNIKFNLMYEEYYHMWKHPLCAVASLEEEPNLDDAEYAGEPIEDVSQWN